MGEYFIWFLAGFLVGAMSFAAIDYCYMKENANSGIVEIGHGGCDGSCN